MAWKSGGTKLSPRMKRALELVDDHGLTFTEAAERMAVTRQVVRDYYMQAKARLEMEGEKDEGRAELVPTLREGVKAPSKPKAEDVQKLRDLLQDAGVGRGRAIQVIRRLQAKRGLTTEVGAATDAAFLAQIMEVRARALGYLDDISLSEASAKDLSQIVTQLTNVVQLLKGEPTSILSVEDRRTLPELKRALLEEMQRRDIIDVTPEAV